MATRKFSRQHQATWYIALAFLGRRFFPLALTASGILFLLGAGTILWWSRDLPNPNGITAQQQTQSTKIYDSTGTHLLYEIGDIHRTLVPLDKISALAIHATLAAEDDKFYEHHGIALNGIIRGLILKPLTGQRAQGGSTITQQLIKNSILSPERTLQRKVKEAVLAVELEQRFGKDKILEMYLNQIPYGNRTYGIEAAAQQYFGTSAANVNVAQAALLASLPQAPSYYSPYGSHFEDLKRRQEYILQRMADLHMISADEAAAAKKEDLQFIPPRENILAPHFVFYVKEQLEKEFGERIVEQGGLKVTTTLDMRLQTIAEDSLKKRQEGLKKLGASNAALTALNPKTGDILAMVGSIDYFNQDIDGNVNVAVRHRSPGSSIKPFVYGAAFAKGYPPSTIVMDAVTDFGQGYSPKDYDLQERGPLTMRQALSNSLNIPAVQTLYLAGVKNAVNFANKMGLVSLTDPNRYGLSLVLGGGEVTLLDETSAYGVFANEGVRFPYRSILKVENTSEVLFDALAIETPGQAVVDPQITRLVTDVLSDNSARSLVFGVNTPLQLGSRPVAAKTGTTQDFRDGWTMGFTPSLVTGVWVGNNDNSPMGKRADGVVVAAPIWNDFMRQALVGTPIEQFVKPSPPDNLPYDILKGQLPEIKAKWVPETGEIYSLDCPINLGQPRTFKELHSLLYYVRRDNPTGPPPTDAQSDPQFDSWEQAAATWREAHNTKVKDNPAEPIHVASLPTPTCTVSNPEDLPKVKIIEPATAALRSSPAHVKVDIDSPHPLREVRFLFDGKEFAKRGSDGPFEADFTFASNASGRKTLQVIAVTEDNLVGQASRAFALNPDTSAPQVAFLAPKDETVVNAAKFPVVFKASAKDPSGIDNVDFLYQKEGGSGTGRIGRTSTLAPTAPDRYEVTWSDSPGPGTYHVYVIAYDKTGNYTQTAPKTFIVE